MTQTTDPVREFRAALPPRMRAHLNTTDRVTAFIHRAITVHGWTLQQLVDECTRDTRDVYKPGGLITSRLERCADAPPTTAGSPRVIPFCTPDCRERGGLLEDPLTGLPVGRCRCRSGD